MTDLKELIAARDKLDAQIATARKIEADASLAKIHSLIKEFGFTAQQVFPWRMPDKKISPKYLDEKTGATWIGRGKPPAWIAGKDREAFLVRESKNTTDGPFLAELAAAAHSDRKL